MALYEFVDISFHFYGIIVIYKISSLMDTSINASSKVHMLWELFCSFVLVTGGRVVSPPTLYFSLILQDPKFSTFCFFFPSSPNYKACFFFPFCYLLACHLSFQLDSTRAETLSCTLFYLQYPARCPTHSSCSNHLD